MTVTWEHHTDKGPLRRIVDRVRIAGTRRACVVLECGHVVERSAMLKPERSACEHCKRGVPRRPLRKRCNQCWKMRRIARFIGPRGKERAKNCNKCTRKYRDWSAKTFEQKVDAMPVRTDTPGTGRVLWVARSLNKKLGPIPMSISERITCPQSCAFFQTGCYADYGPNGAHWRSVGQRGITWEAFLEKVRALPEGQVWRHNEAGDLAGVREFIHPGRLRDLIEANRGRRGFTFTHKTSWLGNLELGISSRMLFRLARNSGFTINLSADSLKEADELSHWDLGPVAVVLPEDHLRRRTPEGRTIVVCPAQTDGLTCAKCQLCTRAHRKAIVGFLAHGQSKRLVSELVRGKRET